MSRPVFIDILVVVLLVIALITGFQRGVIQPLLAEIFFFGTLLVIFRFHDQYTAMLAKFHITAVISVFVALIIAIVLGAVGGAIGGAFHRMESIRGIDGLLGVVVHLGVSLVIIYLAISALVTLDNAFEPALNQANLSLAQVNALESEILSNPITAAMVSKADLEALKSAAQKNNARLDQVQGIHQLQQIYTDFLQPQLHGSRSVPYILGFGHHLPLIGHVGPADLKPLPGGTTTTTCPSPTPKATSTPKTTATPKTTPSPVTCPTPSPTK